MNMKRKSITNICTKKSLNKYDKALDRIKEEITDEELKITICEALTICSQRLERMKEE